MNVREGCWYKVVKHLVYASSSSVYGANEPTLFSGNYNGNHPVSIYVAIKRGNEAMAHSYTFPYAATSLRLFTV